MKCTCGSKNTYCFYKYKNIKRAKCLDCGITFQVDDGGISEVTLSKLFKPAIYKD